MEQEQTLAAFIGDRLLTSGPLEMIIPVIKERFDHDPTTLFFLFEEQSGRQVDFDLRGSLAEALARSAPTKPRIGPGRPKLGVIPREISLLPRHWEWLEQQPNGASAAIRRLVDQAKATEPHVQQTRRAKDALSRIMSAMAGNLHDYEEACRALYADDRQRFEELIATWPADIRSYLCRRAEDAFAARIPEEPAR